MRPPSPRLLIFLSAGMAAALTAGAAEGGLSLPRVAAHVAAAPSAVAAEAKATGAIDLRDLGGWPSAASAPTFAPGEAVVSPATQLWEAWQSRKLEVSFSPLISDAAARTGLPYDFLYRLLRQESGLRADAISPRGALGIAQFMPATALERGLIDPFDPSQAVIKAAELLRDHKDRFGNLGLAAAAYNAGPGRVQRWLAGAAAMPQETRDYVLSVTGRTMETWVPAGQWASLERAPGDAASFVPGMVPPPVLRPLFAAPAKSGTGRTVKGVSLAARRSGTRRAGDVARSEDELCTLVGGSGNACVVRRIY